MGFIRVKSRNTGHEFDVTPERAAQRPDWDVIDSNPVDRPRPAVHGNQPAATQPIAPAADVDGEDAVDAPPVASSGDAKDPRLAKSSTK